MTTVVICDHHRLFGEAFAAALRAAGADVRVAATPAEALTLLDAAPADRVVMSGLFPGDAGPATILEIRRHHPGIHVSSLGAAERPAGAHAALSKSRPLTELVETVLRGGIAARAHAVPATRRRPAATLTSRVDGHSTLAARFLTDRERDVLRLLVGAQQTNQIAASLGISVTTTRGYVQSILAKLGVHSRVQAVSYAVRNSVVS